MGQLMRTALISWIFLTGCTATAPEVVAAGLVPDAGGLQPNGSPLRIDFGRARLGVIQSVTRLKARPAAAPYEVPGCGSVVYWPDGLGLVFVDGDFRGWVLGERSAGVKCG